MRLLRSMICAGALFLAAPALAQDNNAAPANVAAINGPEVNAATAPSNAGQNLAEPTPSVAPPADNGTTAPATGHAGFPWGVLGLLGLIGLFGVRKVKG